MKKATKPKNSPLPACPPVETKPCEHCGTELRKRQYIVEGRMMYSVRFEEVIDAFSRPEAEKLVRGIVQTRAENAAHVHVDVDAFEDIEIDDCEENR